MSDTSSREMSRSPSNSSGSTNITSLSSSQEFETKPSGASKSAFQRWRPSYHLQAPSGWMNVSIHITVTSQRHKLTLSRIHVLPTTTQRQASITSHTNQASTSPMQTGARSRGEPQPPPTWSHGTSSTSPLSSQTRPTTVKASSQAATCLPATAP